jgi:hypothetical protein
MDVRILLLDALGRSGRGAVVLAGAIVLSCAAGCGDGTVAAKGHVNIEGERATGGRLMLTPIGGGKPAFSLVAEDGAFALRTGGDTLGAYPGTYRVLLIGPLEGALRERVARELAGELRTEELSVSYRGPSNAPLVIPEEGDEAIMVDIRQSGGWIRSLNE